MIKDILGGGQELTNLGWVDCSCANGCSGKSYWYFLGYSDGVFAIKNPQPK